MFKGQNFFQRFLQKHRLNYLKLYEKIKLFQQTLVYIHPNLVKSQLILIVSMAKKQLSFLKR